MLSRIIKIEMDYVCTVFNQIYSCLFGLWLYRLIKKAAITDRFQDYISDLSIEYTGLISIGIPDSLSRNFLITGVSTTYFSIIAFDPA